MSSPAYDRARRRRRNRYRALYWLVSVGPAVGVALVAFDVGGIQEPVHDAVTGWLTARADPFGS